MELGCCLAPKVTGQAVRIPPTTGPWPSLHCPCLPGLPLPTKWHQRSQWDQEQNMRVVRTEKLIKSRDNHPSSSMVLPTGLGDTRAAVAGSTTEVAAPSACKAVPTRTPATPSSALRVRGLCAATPAPRYMANRGLQQGHWGQFDDLRPRTEDLVPGEVEPAAPCGRRCCSYY